MEHKNTGRFPGKQMPLLEVDGTVLTQSNAILRYLGRKFGLVADDDLLNYRIDQVADISTDARMMFRRTILEQDPVKRAEIVKEILANDCPTILKQWSDIVGATEGPYIAGSKLTWGDLVLANWALIWPTLDPKVLDAYPVLLRHRDAVLAVPQIKEWIATRPKVMF